MKNAGSVTAMRHNISPRKISGQGPRRRPPPRCHSALTGRSRPYAVVSVMRWQLACLGMAGTTIRDGGLVEQAVTVAVAGQGVVPGTAEHDRMLAVVRKTMGR